MTSSFQYIIARSQRKGQHIEPQHFKHAAGTWKEHTKDGAEEIYNSIIVGQDDIIYKELITWTNDSLNNYQDTLAIIKQEGQYEGAYEFPAIPIAITLPNQYTNPPPITTTPPPRPAIILPKNYYHISTHAPADPKSIYLVLRIDKHGPDQEHTKASQAAARTYAQQLPPHLTNLAQEINEILNQNEPTTTPAHNDPPKIRKLRTQYTWTESEGKTENPPIRPTKTATLFTLITIALAATYLAIHYLLTTIKP